MILFPKGSASNKSLIESNFHTINQLQQKRFYSTNHNSKNELDQFISKKTNDNGTIGSNGKFHDYATVILDIINFYFLPDSPHLDERLNELERLCKDEIFSTDEDENENGKELAMVKVRKNKSIAKRETGKEELYSIEDNEDDKKLNSRKSSRANSFINGLNKKYNSMFNMNSNLNSKLDLSLKEQQDPQDEPTYHFGDDDQEDAKILENYKIDEEFENQFLLPKSKKLNPKRRPKFSTMRSFTQKIKNEDVGYKLTSIFRVSSNDDEEQEIRTGSSIKSDSELMPGGRKRKVKIQEQKNQYILPTPTLIKTAKFGFYLLTPILIMYYVGLDTDKKFNLPGFWPDPKTLNQIPKEPHEIQAEVARIRKVRAEKRQKLEAKARELGIIEDDDEETSK
ncbi:PET100 [Candida jiufengensis]|uniref:PET100 n=1 Tax=Candida jiufengensis TaxID=497108 RepID=UPI00222565DF|nr:PET100 [Candida jiufengensis]KAI5954346.1 PET100 [Candida jiufengensis]